ncbi:MAG TPA: hypothetical protein VGH79_02595 [Gaiellaceae bacterium]
MLVSDWRPVAPNPEPTCGECRLDRAFERKLEAMTPEEGAAELALYQSFEARHVANGSAPHAHTKTTRARVARRKDAFAERRARSVTTNSQE